MIINGRKVEVNLDITTWEDDSRLSLSPNDGRKRKTRWPRMIINHTTKGWPTTKNGKNQQHIIEDIPPNKGKEFDVARYWKNSPKQSAAHFVIDVDGSVGQLADIFSTVTYHATVSNEFSVGIEMYQESDGGIWRPTLEACAQLNLEICKALGIQFQIHKPYEQKPINRLKSGGKECVGIFGHRLNTNNRGPGDPGDFIDDFLIDLGAEVFDFDRNEDIETWKERQDVLGLVSDGIPGPQTVQALKEAGYRHGIYALGKGKEETTGGFRSLLCKALGCNND